jgi:hypothetical protein
MMSGPNGVAQATVPVFVALIAVVGLVLPASAASSAGYPQIHRFRPTVTLRQCESAGGAVEAVSRTKAVCSGGLDNGDPVVGE